jgi:hypothetical protein
VDYTALKGSPEFAQYKTLVRELQAVDATSIGDEAERCVCMLPARRAVPRQLRAAAGVLHRTEAADGGQQESCSKRALDGTGLCIAQGLGRDDSGGGC